MASVLAHFLTLSCDQATFSCKDLACSAVLPNSGARNLGPNETIHLNGLRVTVVIVIII